MSKSIFERFTVEAMKIIMLCQQEAMRLGHTSIGTEHFLLGLIEEGNGVAATVLTSMGVNLEDARREVEAIVGRGKGIRGIEIPFTDRAKRVSEFALVEAQLMRCDHIKTEHLLLALLREREGVGYQVLERLGVDPIEVRSQVLETLG